MELDDTPPNIIGSLSTDEGPMESMAKANIGTARVKSHIDRKSLLQDREESTELASYYNKQRVTTTNRLQCQNYPRKGIE